MKQFAFIICILLVDCSPQENKRSTVAEEQFFESLKLNDVALKTPMEGEWLHEHEEPGQTFEQYKQADPITVTAAQNIIFLKPVGKFSEEQQEILQYTADYLTIFFQVKTQLLASSTDSIIPETARRIGRDGNEQLLAPYILSNLLKDKLPKNGLVMMAVTEKDLYPKPGWNFVFGLASYQEGIGVSSIKRLCSNIDDSVNYNICLSRLIQVASHEIGHMFSLHHCTNAKCTMNGSNSLPESDRQPNRQCSECVKKMYWNIGFDNKKRLNELQAYFEKHKLSKDWRLATADIEKSDNK